MGCALLKGCLYCALWYLSIVAGYICLFCPILPFIFVSNRLYRHCTDFILTYWQLYPTVLLKLIFGCQVQVTGDALIPGETTLLLMNHRTRTDWNFLWPAVYQAAGKRSRHRMYHPTKFVLKDLIRHIPGIGWIMQLSCFLYIKRHWASDKVRIESLLEYFSAMRYKFNMLIFPEGTDLTAETKAISDAFAAKNKLPKYDYVLHPRTTGFMYLAHKLIAKKELDAIIDITLVYCDHVPQTEKAILTGNVPKLVKMHFSKYPVHLLSPSEQGLKQFLEHRWQEKERVLREFHRSGRFRSGKPVHLHAPMELLMAFVFWTALPSVAVYLLYENEIFRHLVIAHTVFLLFVNYVSNGFQNFEIALFQMKKRIFGIGF